LRFRGLVPDYYLFGEPKKTCGEVLKKYDVIVIGSGAGASIVERALSQELKVALVDKGPIGGTCLNVGCIPSKILIFPADRIMEINSSKKLGLNAKIDDIDFSAIMNRMKTIVDNERSQIHTGLKSPENLDLYESEARFVSDYTLDIGDEKIKGEKIFIATGARPQVPSVKGLEEADYLTNESVLQLKERPESMIIIGGGYIATEFAHFLSAMGTDITILQRGSRLVPGEEPEISELLRKEMEKRMRVQINTEAVEVRSEGGTVTVVGREGKNGKTRDFTAERLMVAAGRVSNADLLEVDNTGVKTDERGYMIVNGYLETSKKRIWAIGDATGREMFRHVANEEAELAWHNSMTEHKAEINYSATPHAVFTYPQIASVGLRESEAQKAGGEILVGKAMYSMMEEEAFAKAIVDKDSLKILGFHIIGPYAAILIQEIVNVMASQGDIYTIAHGMHIHPALSEVVVAALGNLEETS
jgi:dihydrolipoamide dehydrogenase